MVVVCVAADLVPGGLGGAEVHVVEVIKYLSGRHQIILFVGAKTMIKQRFSQGVTVVPVRYLQIPNLKGLTYIFFGYYQILKYLRGSGISVDLVWAKQSFPQGPLAAMIANRLKRPLYITAQNPRLLHEELVVSLLLRPGQQVLARLIDPLISWAYKRAGVVATVSRYAAGWAKRYGAKRVVVIPNGVNPMTYKVKHGIPGKKLNLISNSALIPRNGLDTLIEAVAMLPRKLDWQLEIAGDGPLYRPLKAKIKSLGLSRRIKLLGRVANEKIPSLINQSDMFIRPSRHEGFGVAFIEAMASGVPVIATPVGGITDFVEHLKTGYLVEPNQPEQLAQAIMTLANQPKLYRQVQAKALDLVRRKYNWPVIAKKVEKQMLSLTVYK